MNSVEASLLYETYNNEFTDWHLSTDHVDAVTAYTAALMGDKTRVDKYLQHIVNHLQLGQLPDGWTIEQAGYVMLAAHTAQQLPYQASVQITKPEDGSSSAGLAEPIKGTAIGTESVEIIWQELYSDRKGRLVVSVLPNGKWNATLNGLKRGLEYDLKISAIDESGYVISNTEKIRFKVSGRK